MNTVMPYTNTSLNLTFLPDFRANSSPKPSDSHRPKPTLVTRRQTINSVSPLSCEIPPIRVPSLLAHFPPYSTARQAGSFETTSATVALCDRNETLLSHESRVECIYSIDCRVRYCE